MLYEKFGEFDSAEELNRAAEAQKNEGDIEALKLLAKENGIDAEDAKDYANGDTSALCTPLTAALGKLSVERADLKSSEMISDWIDYIESTLIGDERMQLAVRRKGKSIIECIGKLLAWSFNNQYRIDDRIVKASGLALPEYLKKNGVHVGSPGIATSKKLIREYYLGEKS